MMRLLLLSTLAAAEAKYPTPAVQTQVQKTVIANAIPKAKQASEAATANVIAIFDSSTFRAGLKKCCPQVAELPSDELLSRFRAEMQTAELAHTFPSGFGSSHFKDITIPLAREYDFFLNEWQAPIITNSTPSTMYNLAEENIYGCPAFADDSHPTWDEAADRMLYIAHNMRQLDTGSLPTFGDVAAIFRKSYVKDMVLIAAVDTGVWEMACNSSAFKNSSHLFKLNLDCNYLNSTVVGTLDYADHLIYANLGAWAKVFNNTIEEQAVNLFNRSAFAGNYLNLPNVTSMEGLGYFESNILGNVPLQDGVSFLIGNFHTMFGTDAGREMQLLADHYSWPLVWGRGQGSSTPHPLQDSFGPDKNPYPGNGRVLDPEVAATQGLNATIGVGANEAFVKVWLEVANRRKNILPISEAQWSTWWAELAASQAQLAPISAQAGCSENLCIGTMATSGECVCKKASAIVV